MGCDICGFGTVAVSASGVTLGVLWPTLADLDAKLKEVFTLANIGAKKQQKCRGSFLQLYDNKFNILFVLITTPM